MGKMKGLITELEEQNNPIDIPKEIDTIKMLAITKCPNVTKVTVVIQTSNINIKPLILPF